VRSSIQKVEVELGQGGNLNVMKRERTSRYKPGKNQDNGLLPGHRKKHDKIMGRSMTRLWKKTWQGHDRKHGQVMKRSVTMSWK